MKFEWNWSKAELNKRKHGVSFDEAKTVFDDNWQEHFPDELHSDEEERWICLGTSVQGRVLFVAYAKRGERYRLISARAATKREEERYYAARGYYS